MSPKNFLSVSYISITTLSLLLLSFFPSVGGTGDVEGMDASEVEDLT